jgi:hypothetical protein
MERIPEGREDSVGEVENADQSVSGGAGEFEMLPAFSMDLARGGAC